MNLIDHDRKKTKLSRQTDKAQITVLQYENKYYLTIIPPISSSLRDFWPCQRYFTKVNLTI